jgi:single-stranded DNA-binding protein
VWGKQAESSHQYLRKGRQVLVEGRLNPDDNGNPRFWTAQDGTPRSSFDVTAETVRFIGGAGRDEGAVGGEEGGLGTGPANEDEIPF